MTRESSSPFFSHEERIVVSPFQYHTIVRLEATTLLREYCKNDENIDTTPFPRVVRDLIYNGISRLSLASGSSSLNTYDTSHPLQDEYSTGPSGIRVIVELKDEARFHTLLALLDRFLLAPLDAVRLHRHVYKKKLSNEITRMEVILPLEESAVALEGVRDFYGVGNVCPQHGIFSSLHSQALSEILLGVSTNVAVSQRERRRMWMEVQTGCNDSACDVTLKRGLQYGIVLNEGTQQTVKLSKIVPFTSFQECPVADSKAKLSTIMHRESEDGIVETVVQDWNMGSVMNLSTLQDISQHTPQLYGNRIVLRPSGVANSGRLVTRMGSSMECPSTVQVVEVLPPFVMPLWDTWTLTDSTTKPILTIQTDGTIVVEYNITLSPKTEVEVTLDYEPVLLPFQQFPADPNRGMELPPSRFTFESDCLSLESMQLYSSPVLLMPPVPDMSMPFNVISLTCTLYAFVIGSLANLLVRKASQRIKSKLYPEEHKSKLQKLKERLRNKLGRFKKKKKKPSEVEANGEDSDNGDASSTKDEGKNTALAGDDTCKEVTTGPVQ